jgi:hypothetical protein
MTSSDALTPLTKLVLYGAGVLAVVAGPVLYFFPADTDVYFAWEIQHVLTPVFMGANYLAGLGAVWTARMDRWSVARVTLPAIIAFAITQLVATLLHLDIFKWSHPVAWAWLAVYIVSPVAALAVTIDQERRWDRATGDGARAEGAVQRPIFVALAAIWLVIGLALFVAPEAMNRVWPWSITPLTGRVIGGWFLSGVFLHGMLAREPAMERARIALISILVVAILSLIGAGLHRGAFDGPAPSTVLYVVGWLAVGLVNLSYLLGTKRAS